MNKLSVILTILLGVPSISAHARTLTQEVLSEVNTACQSQLSNDYTYRECDLPVPYFPFGSDAEFKKKFMAVVTQAGYKVKGDPVSEIDTKVHPMFIVYGNVLSTNTNIMRNPKGALIDKAGVEYSVHLYYAPFTNKLIIKPLSIKGHEYASWIGDLQDATLRKGIIQFGKNAFIQSRGDTEENQLIFKNWINKELREFKLNLGVNVTYPGFKYYDANYLLPHEKK